METKQEALESMTPAPQPFTCYTTTLLRLAEQSAVFANANRAAIVGLDDVVEAAVVGCHLVDLGNLLATASLIPNRLFHGIGQLAKFNLLGVAQVDIARALEPVVVIVIAISIPLIVVASVVIAVAGVSAVIQQLGVGVVRDHFP